MRGGIFSTACQLFPLFLPVLFARKERVKNKSTNTTRCVYINYV